MKLLLDLCCCAGGASAGYVAAGFMVVGVDNKHQPNYPWEFIKGDALKFLSQNWKRFDAFHASPPCQLWTPATNQWKSTKTYPDLIARLRKEFLKHDRPWVMENVMGSPLLQPIMLCGTMFKLCTYRHRLFESNFKLVAPKHKSHLYAQTKMGRPPVVGEMLQLVGHFSGVPLGRKIIGAPWMSQYELAQAIPSAYTKYIGKRIP